MNSRSEDYRWAYELRTLSKTCDYRCWGISMARHDMRAGKTTRSVVVPEGFRLPRPAFCLYCKANDSCCTLYPTTSATARHHWWRKISSASCDLIQRINAVFSPSAPKASPQNRFIQARIEIFINIELWSSRHVSPSWLNWVLSGRVAFILSSSLVVRWKCTCFPADVKLAWRKILYWSLTVWLILCDQNLWNPWYSMQDLCGRGSLGLYSCIALLIIPDSDYIDCYHDWNVELHFCFIQLMTA